MSFDVSMDQGVSIPKALISEAVSVQLVAEKVRVSLRVKAGDRVSVGKALGVNLPAKIGHTKTQNELMVACLGPEEWFLVGDEKSHSELYDTCNKLSQDYVISAVDVSHRNIGLALSGTDAAGMINVGCPLDLSLSQFPVGKCVRSVFENAPVLLYRASETVFEVECWRSFAPYVVGLMAMHARATAP